MPSGRSDNDANGSGGCFTLRDPERSSDLSSLRSQFKYYNLQNARGMGEGER